MKNRSVHLAIMLALGITLPLLAAETAKPVRMGSGVMTFDTVPGWGLRPDGKSALGPTHGGVVVDSKGNIYTSANKGVVVFSPDGKVIQEYLGPKYSNMHDMEIRKEADGEFIYAARNAAAEGIKFDAHSGKIVLKMPFPKESGLALKRFSPTAITVTANGDIYLSDGYASNHIFKFDKNGKYQKKDGAFACLDDKSTGYWEKNVSKDVARASEFPHFKNLINLSSHFAGVFFAFH